MRSAQSVKIAQHRDAENANRAKRKRRKKRRVERGKKRETGTLGRVKPLA